MIHRLSIAAAVLLGAAVVGPLSAQQKAPEKQLVMRASNITAKEQAVASNKPADSLRATLPGDLMEYRMVFTNTKRIALKNVRFDNPVPRGLVYAIGSAKADRPDANVEFSIDGGATWSANPQIEVIEAGQKVRRAAPPEMYTHVRWHVTGDVAPGAKVVAQFRARMKGSAGAAPSRRTPVK